MSQVTAPNNPFAGINTSSGISNLMNYQNFNATKGLAQIGQGAQMSPLPTVNSSGQTISQGTVPETDAGGFGLKGVGAVLSGIASLGGLYNSYQANKLAKRQFKASLADRNQNIANAAATTNLALRNQASMAGQMSGNAFGSQSLANYKDQNTVQVDGSAIHA